MIFMNFNNSIHIYNLFWVYIMYACMYMCFVPEINLFVKACRPTRLVVEETCV